MGWANCGEDSTGRPIGYAHEGTCDHPGCTEKIHRGLAYVCGDMHGDDEISCELYFCGKHRQGWVKTSDGRNINVCAKCEKLWREQNPEAAEALDNE